MPRPSAPTTPHAVRIALALAALALAATASAQPTPTVASTAMASFIDDASMASWFHVDPLPAFDFVDQVEPFLLDVRLEHEYAAGHLAGSVRIYVTELEEHHELLPRDLAAPMLVYCTGGLHGTFALVYLRFLGYTNVRNLRGGFAAWDAAGLPVVRP